MIRASLYIAACTARNRLRMRLRRLRQPRYLLGGIAGIAYLYLTMFARRPSSTRRPGGPRSEAAVASLLTAAPPVVGTGLLALAAAAWVVPLNSALIEFSDAEVDFLFTAPVTRSQLLLHRIIRSQMGLVFAAAIPLIVYPGLSSLARLRSAVALWLILLTLRVYFTGVTLARRALSSGDARARRFAGVAAATVALATVAVGAALVRAFVREPAANIRDAVALIARVMSTGWPHAIVWPLSAVVRPIFATAAGPFFAALPGAFVVLAVVSIWALRTDRRLYDLSGHSTARTGDEQARPSAPAALRRTPWKLAPAGRPELAIAWRTAVEMVRGVGGGTVRRPVLAFIMMGVVAVMASRQRGIAQIAAVIATFWTGASILFGPQMLRIDLRQDLQHIDVLKTWPVKPAAIIRGELVCPAATLTLVAWAALAFALAVSGAAFGAVPLAWRLAVGAGAAILAPAVIAAQLVIQNAAALAFPAWIAIGSQRPRGFDAMGQRLILLVATMAILSIMLLPGAIAGAVVWLGLRRLIGAAAVVPAAVAMAAVIVLEVLVATETMAPLYERLDLSEVERAET